MVLLSDNLMLEKSSTEKLIVISFRWTLRLTIQLLLCPWTSWKNKTLIFYAMWNCSFGITWSWLWRLGQCLFEFALKWALCRSRIINSKQKMYTEHQKITGTLRPHSLFFSFCEELYISATLQNLLDTHHSIQQCTLVYLTQSLCFQCKGCWSAVSTYIKLTYHMIKGISYWSSVNSI